MWADSMNLVSISDVALLKRFRKCGRWLGHLVLTKITERCELELSVREDLRIRVVDATHLCSPGAKGSQWRLHVGLDLASLMIDHVEFSDWRVGESFDRFPVTADELLIGDRGYAHRDPMARVAEAGGFFLVRIPWNIVPLNTPDGEALELFSFLRSIPEAAVGELSVSFTAHKHTEIPCRLIALRKTAVCAEASRQKVLSEKSRKSRSIDPRSLEAAEYTILLTNASAESMSPHKALELYRLRWQIENVFKRFKSLLNLDQLAAREPSMVQTYVLAKILGAMLVEDLTDRYLSFFPWGYPLRTAGNLPLASPQARS